MKATTKIVLSALVLFAVFVWTSLAKSPASDGVNLYYFDIGQGDAALIQKDNYQILIDGGPDDTILAKLGEVMPMTDRNIELVILSHPHADHLVGINQILERYDVGKIYSSGVLHTSNEYLEFLETVQNDEIELVIPSVGFELVPFENSQLQFLWPGDKYVGESMKNLNNSSEVVRFCYYDQCSLFTGDLETDGQAEMLALLEQKEINIESKYIKIAHHGSSNGTNQELLNSVKPEVAVVSVGEDNQFGHPHSRIIDLLLENNAEIRRTDRDGDIIIAF